MIRAVWLAAALGALARVAGAQLDTAAVRDSTRRDTTARDSVPHFLSLPPAPAPLGPLPRGARYSFNTDSIAFSDTKTLSDLLARIPGVYVARGGLYGQAEAVLYGGRGPLGLEVYWDGVPYWPLGRDSVYLDPARISLAPLERVDVVLLPATLRVYLVTRRQQSTAPASDVGITTGALGTAGYRGSFLKRWRSGLGLSLLADWNDITGPGQSATTPFHGVDLWLKTDWVPHGTYGASYQILSTDWHRSASTMYPVKAVRSRRVEQLFQVFAGGRPDGLGPRASLSFLTSAVSRDTGANDRSISEASLALSTAARRGAAVVTARVGPHASPFQLEAQAFWTPLPVFTLAADARHAAYTGGRDGDRAHVAAGIALPLGFSLHGDVAWTRDLQAPTLPVDSVQATTDLGGGVRWDGRWGSVEVGGARRDAFVPALTFLSGLSGVAALAPTPTTDYVTVHGSLRLLPGLSLTGWY